MSGRAVGCVGVWVGSSGAWDVPRCAPYVRELSEVGGVDVEPVRQPLHQVQALVAGEGAASGRDTTQKRWASDSLELKC